jgi:hypothetical protein
MPTTETQSQQSSRSIDDQPKKHDITELNALYTDGDSIDTEVFAEMRSNILLVTGEHYNRRQSNFYKRVRDSKELSIEQKLRLTKNHVQNICKKYVNNIISHQPGVGFSPRREDDLHNQKMTDLHKKLWQDAKQKYNIDDKIDDWCDDFVEIGEVNVKIFYDPSGGEIKGFDPLIDDETGQVLLNEFQQPMPDPMSPQFEGAFIFEDIYGFNLLRPSECKDMRAAEWVCNRKMANIPDLKSKIKDEDKQKYLTSSQDETYLVFDGSRGSYRKTKNQTMLREYYFRPCSQYPHGQFYITTKEGIIDGDALPGSVFPIVTALFDRIQTTPRGRGPIKHMRPYQAEINRSASKIAEHQITLGDDKLLLHNGSKISAGVALPGIRSVNYTGNKAEVLPGRSGEQYVAYMQSQIQELYQIMGIPEDSEETQQNADPYVMLYKAARQKVKFGRWIKRFEKFYIEIVKTYLRLAKIHMTDEALLAALGEDERGNLEEFRNSDDLAFDINIEAQADDIETKFGKQMVMNHTLQYVGSQLKPDDIGKILREMPYANSEGAFDDMTLDYDLAVDDILALDRGEKPPVGQYDNHPYLIKKLTSRMRKRDFKYLSPQVQNNYEQKIGIHQQFEAQRTLQIQRAEQGFIPTGGYMITCQMYLTDPSDPTGKKTRLARVPYQALEWLVQHLNAQGQGQDELHGMDESSQSQIAQKLNSMNGGGSPMPQPGNAPGGATPGGAHPLLNRGGQPGQAQPPQMGTAMPGGM